MTAAHGYSIPSRLVSRCHADLLSAVHPRPLVVQDREGETHRGFSMELSSTVTVVLASLLKLPVSTLYQTFWCSPHRYLALVPSTTDEKTTNTISLVSHHPLPNNSPCIKVLHVKTARAFSNLWRSGMYTLSLGFMASALNICGLGLT
jgi:hypothetical protein